MTYGRIERGPMGADVVGKDFTQIYNKAVRDKRLSWKSRGMLLWILSHREGFGISVASLVAAGPGGEKAVYSALKELEDHGYLRRRQAQDPDTKQFTAMIFRVTDIPDGATIHIPSPWETEEKEEPRKNPSSEPVAGNREPDVTGHNIRYRDAGQGRAGQGRAGNAVHKKTNPEGVVLRDSPGETSPEEHSLTVSAGKSALPGGESEQQGYRPSIEEITGAGATVARQGKAGHVAGCSCPDCLRIRSNSVPQQPTGHRPPDDGWLDDLLKNANQS